jgi:hypothetical protein
MFSSNRDDIRRFFLTAWRKHQDGEVASPLEHMVASIVARHPEYHALLADEETALAADFQEAHGIPNPFLHLGMHISLQEQLDTDRPSGIRVLYQQAGRRTGDAHAAEHLMMECLAKTLWEAQSTGAMPDEARYLDCLRRIAAG